MQNEPPSGIARQLIRIIGERIRIIGIRESEREPEPYEDSIRPEKVARGEKAIIREKPAIYEKPVITKESAVSQKWSTSELTTPLKSESRTIPHSTMTAKSATHSSAPSKSPRADRQDPKGYGQQKGPKLFHRRERRPRNLGRPPAFCLGTSGYRN
jgi:hypothetical protein